MELLKYAHTRNVKILPEVSTRNWGLPEVIPPCPCCCQESLSHPIPSLLLTLQFNMPAHAHARARARVIAMETRAKKGNTSYHLTDPIKETHLRTIQCYDRTPILNPYLTLSVMFVEKLVAEVKGMHDAAGVPLES